MNQPCFIGLLGGLHVQQGDRVITRFNTQKTAALLAYLACFLKRSHPREELLELLWPDSDPRDGRASLRMALSSLRRQLEPPGTPFNSVLVADRLNVRLNPQVTSTDAARFESLAQSAARITDTNERTQALTQAVELYRGPLLPGFYEEWALRERERVEQVYIRALRQLTDLREQQGELGQAIECALRCVHSDPFTEEARRDLIRLYLATGQVDAARHQYSELERLFREELGAAPSPETQALAAHLPAAHRTDATTRAAILQPNLVHAALPVSVPLFAPLTSPASQPPSPHLPLHLTPFFGRKDEMARLQELVSGRVVRDQPDVHHSLPASSPSRLITLTGPGGSGKTRLAVEVGKRLGELFAGAVWFVPLGDITDAGLILDCLRVALRLAPSSDLQPMEQIAQALSRQPSLLILDNFEQVVEEGAPVVWTLLEQIPTLSCLVTSRQRLDLGGEREFPVPPLPVPTDVQEANIPEFPDLLTPQHLIQFASVQLFVDRAQAARSDFQITRQNAPTIAAVCARLEGLPLALELAAAWAALLTPSQMLTRLEDRFTLLASRRKDLSARQRSLRDAIEWSYRLLTPEQQRFFVRLCVFRGGWTLDAAEAVCEEPLSMDYLQQLRSRSLVAVEERRGEMRFRLLETLRAYGWERLMESGEAERMRRRHRDYFLRLVEEARPKMQSGEQAATLAMLEAEHDNLRAALQFSVEGLRGRDDGEDSPVSTLNPTSSTEEGLRLGVALSPFWEVRGYLSEGRKWLEALLEGSGDASDFWRAKTLGAAGTLAWQQADYDSARAFFAQSLALFRPRGEKQGIAEALHGLGVVAEKQADYAAARALLKESLEIKRELGDLSGLAASLNTLANVLADQGEYASARALYEESLLLRRELADQRGISGSLNNLALVAYEQWDYATARTLLEESLALRRELGDMRGISICLNNLGDLAWREGEIAIAHSLYEEALAIRRQLGDMRGVASSLAHLANLAAEQGDPATARSLYAESLVILRELEDRRGITGCLEEIAKLAAVQGQPERAARLFGAAERLRETMDAPLPPVEQTAYDRTVTALLARLEEAAFTAAWQDGRAMTSEQTIEYALSNPLSVSLPPQ